MGDVCLSMALVTRKDLYVYNRRRMRRDEYLSGEGSKLSRIRTKTGSNKMKRNISFIIVSPVSQNHPPFAFQSTFLKFRPC